MGVWITGDIHGNPVRLSTDSFYEQKEFSSNKDENVVIIAGDFGLVWSRDGETKQEKWWLDWLEDKPFTTVFVDGNHENHKRLATYPIKEWNGGKVHEIRPHVLHLQRGEVYTIQNKKFFTFGGARSHDISDGILDYEDEEWRDKAKALDKQGKYMYRVKGLTWWEEEMPSKEEMQHGLDNLEKNNWEVDYIITHDCPSSTKALIGFGKYETDDLNKYFEEIHQKCNFKNWIFGHYHTNKYINDKDIVVYDNISRIV